MKKDVLAVLGKVMDLLLDAVCVVDIDGRFVYVSAAGEGIFGYTPDEMIGRPMIDLVHADDRARTLATVDEILGGELKPLFENRYVRKDGRIVHIMWSARWSEADQVRVAVARDITERKRAESMQAALHAISEAAQQTDDLHTLLAQIHHVVAGLLPADKLFIALHDAARGELSFPYFVDAHRTAPAAGPLDGRSLSAEVIRSGKTLRLSRDPAAESPPRAWVDAGDHALDWLGVPLAGQRGVIGALIVQIGSGEARYTDADSELLQFVSTPIAAAIERRQMESRLQHSARHDPLTDLPNRALFHDRLETSLAWARRDRSQLAVLYLDLDGFKQVNDAFGHAAGDELLQEVARRLRACVRDSDTIGRVGGDEFLVLLHDVHALANVLVVAEKIRLAIDQPVEHGRHALRVTPSIGVALYPDHGNEHRLLIRRADEAMYRAKKQGGDRAELAEIVRAGN